jgi:hypothetical protein
MILDDRLRDRLCVLQLLILGPQVGLEQVVTMVVPITRIGIAACASV